MVNIAVLGYGTVGSGVVEVINTNHESINKRAGQEINIKYVLDLRDFPGDPVQEVLVHDYEIIANDPEVDIVVEVMGGGVTITRPLEQITFLDVYKAVECAPDEELFHFHENPNQKCPVGKNIHHVLDKRLLEVQKAMEEKLSEMTLADVKKDIAVYTEEE